MMIMVVRYDNLDDGDDDDISMMRRRRRIIIITNDNINHLHSIQALCPLVHDFINSTEVACT